MKILTINAGSSSLKTALIDYPEQNVIATANCDGFSEHAKLSGSFFKKVQLHIKDHHHAVKQILDLFMEHKVISSMKDIDAIGHRVVHGGERFTDPVIIDDTILEEIESLNELAPLHNPANLQGIRACTDIGCPMIAVFDTAFHSSISYPLYAIPKNLAQEMRIRKYGFHGINHSHIAAEMQKILKKDPNVISCHLGNGCSICAIKEGRSIDTSMGMTPLDGLVMGTRSGAIDPGIIFYMHRKGLSIDEIDTMLNKRSGLVGISMISNDMRTLLEQYDKQLDAKLAVDTFIDRIIHYIGAYAFKLGKVDALVFTGGIGERAGFIREQICRQIETFGFEIDVQKNQSNARQIGKNIYIIPADEEMAIAGATFNVLQTV
ncbi:acetate kinase [Candidatus Woesearchaeota archaeon]|nr:acetate kinase [Candidatus Woesearchaeota archaeon]